MVGSQRICKNFHGDQFQQIEINELQQKKMKPKKNNFSIIAHISGTGKPQADGHKHIHKPSNYTVFGTKSPQTLSPCLLILSQFNSRFNCLALYIRSHIYTFNNFLFNILMCECLSTYTSSNRYHTQHSLKSKAAEKKLGKGSPNCLSASFTSPTQRRQSFYKAYCTPEIGQFISWISDDALPISHGPVLVYWDHYSNACAR